MKTNTNKWVMIAVPLVAFQPLGALQGVQEAAPVQRRVEFVEMIPGTPESDAFRFYSSTQRNEYVEFNYDEAKAGELGKDYTLEDPLLFFDGRKVTKENWPAPYSESAVRPPFGYVRRTECHGLSPYDWKWAIDFARRVLP